MKTPTLVLIVLALAGCASAPKPLRGEFAPLAPVDASATQRTGESVRWGGNIVAVTPAPGQTCFEILGRDLGDSGRPRFRDDTSSGRFLACRQGFYDPAIFAQDREVTVTGVIDGFEQRRIGEYDYTYPRVAADVIYLWPERDPDDLYYFHADPFWPVYRPWHWGGYHVPIRRYHVHPRPRSEAPPPAESRSK